MRIGFVLTHRYSIFSMNSFLFIITLFTLWDASVLLKDMIDNATAIENLLEGVATIFVAYGVALEERDTIMKVFKLYPKLESPEQGAIDKLCHFYGLSYLLIGLFMEVVIEIVKLPCRILSNAQAEKAIFIVGLLFCFAALFSLFKNNYALLKKN